MGFSEPLGLDEIYHPPGQGPVGILLESLPGNPALPVRQFDFPLDGAFHGVREQGSRELPDLRSFLVGIIGRTALFLAVSQASRIFVFSTLTR